MPEREIVVNTGPVIALIAALGDLRILRDLYKRVIVPYEVCKEILSTNATRFGAAEFIAATWLEKQEQAARLARTRWIMAGFPQYFE